ncbi:hypothetical protein PC129_g4628 [Phytophthora cactorum]|uniref:BZIP domain-containing protein n=1 Tax=Phytophthora cactorum TaxID=29920 RepID=A0A329SL14_9STRA|nr:hypothetical protein Pcac1_g7848 [Phytophthora cactorum]KAG2821994.1 hypothetical protein PC112_g11131 [Phytophthora cactorum]KAG2824408.1 hypothetical protein PC111_g9831 [Phytophthora cactorum]KAG2862122.1 hypothetical protein PC113_g6584 [Phytophthora cactorum]KAG2918432.1 hypothetical protein PC114_g6838 [Phytophthora cactorum]
MDVFSRSPPNSFSFSSDVIRSEIQRAGPPRASYFVHDESGLATIPSQSDQHQSPSRSLSSAFDKETFGSTAATVPASGKGKKATPEELLKRKIRRREVCRVNQQRYMHKQRQLLIGLEHDVRRLQEELKSFELQHHSMTMGIPTQDTVWSVAVEYFRLFRHGFRSPPDPLNAFALKFLRLSMAPDVTTGFEYGPEALLENWKRFSLCFDDVRVQLRRLETGDAVDSLVVSTITSITISSDTLRQAFPHLNSDGQAGVRGGEWSPLVAKLLDRRLVVQGSVSFDWDSKTDRVTRVMTQLDMLTPMLRLLGSLEDVSRVFENALITPEGRLSGAEYRFIE